VSGSPAVEPEAVPALRLLARPGPPLGLVFGATGVLATLAVGLLHLDRLPVAFCYLKVFTGLPCPTCGSTRALGRLFALDLGGAVAMNPLATLGAALIALWAAADLALLPRGRALVLEVSPRAGVVLRAAAIAAVALNWIYLLAAGR
jgi:hypothetical protein